MKITDYKKIFTKKFFSKDYEVYKIKVEEYKSFLEKELLSNPKNVKAACILASVYMALREDTKSSILVMEKLLKNYGKSLTKNEKCELYTNLAFYYTEEIGNVKKGEKYLKKAVRLSSHFPQTYEALAIYYADEYYCKDLSKNKKPDYKKSRQLFKKALHLKNESKYKYNYAISLYCNKKTEDACILLEDLIKIKDELYYPSLYAYTVCKFYMGDKKTCLRLTNKLAKNIDKLGKFNPEIGESDIADLYYLLEEYEKHNDMYDNARIKYYLNTDYLSTYLYSLYALRKESELKTFYNNIVKEKLKDIASYEDKRKYKDYSEKEKKENISELKKEIKAIEKLYIKITEKNYKPVCDIKLSFSYGCYLVDCIRHSRI